MKRVVGWGALEGVAKTALVRGSVLTLGIFDGVHRGHQALLAQAARVAEGGGWSRVHLSFEPHPDLLLRGRAPLRLMDVDELDARLALLGVGVRCNLPFDAPMRDTPWHEFLERVVSICNVRAIVVSPESSFGARREGSVERVRAWSGERGISVTRVREARYAGLPIRSSRIRDAIRGGDLSAANDMLGRPYAITGRVERGQISPIAGGAPWLLPPAGAYRVRLGGVTTPGGPLAPTGRLATALLDPEPPFIHLRSTPLVRSVLREGEFVRLALLAGRPSA